MALINANRAANGRAPVQENSRLSPAARAHAQDMFTNEYFDHVSPDGARFTTRAARAGYSCAIAENLASGQDSAAEVMDAWMQSSGHRRNLLLANASEYGVGRVGDMWVLMMGQGC